MTVLAHTEFSAHERILFAHDPESGLRAIIALHNTQLGPAVGGCRMYPYASDAEALNDVLRLSRGMTYKSALAGLPFGGGKSVIIGDPRHEKTPELLKAMGKAVQDLGGKYIIAEDSGTSPNDMRVIGQSTEFVTGIEDADHGGDPSPATARGVFMGMKAAAAAKFGTTSLKGKRVAIQGLGHVGFNLGRV